MCFPYKFITIEGCIGAGKTSLSSRLASDFNGKLILEQFEENSFLPKFYKNPERYAFPLELSFLAERFQQFKEKVLNPDLFADYIISDYIFQKSLIFSRKTLQADEYALYSKLFGIIDANLPKPDIILYLYLSPEELKRNIVLRGRTYEQNIELDYLNRIQQSYMDYFKEQPNQRIVIVNTSDLDFVKNEDDYKKIIAVLKSQFGPGTHRLKP